MVPVYKQLSRVATRGLATPAVSSNTPSSNRRNVVFIDGVRTPFLQANTDYNDLMPVDLQRHAILSLMRKLKVPEKEIGYVVCGTGMYRSLFIH